MAIVATESPTPPPRLLDQVRSAIRLRHYSYKTEKTYVHWIKRYIFFHEKRHPKDLGAEHIVQYLNHLASNCHVSAGTQNQALCALVFLYKQVLQREPGEFKGLIFAKRPHYIPAILSEQEVTKILYQLSGTPWLMVSLLFGTGMRLSECLRLRVKDLDFERNQIIIRDAKGEKDRVVMFPLVVKAPLTQHLLRVKQLHERDLAEGFGTVEMPYALERKYPNANKEWGWKFVFPSYKRSIDPRSGVERRHHLYDSILQEYVKNAVRKAGINKRVTAHSFRHAFATMLLQNNYDIRTVQELLGHSNVKTTMIYTHVLERGPSGTQSPLDAMKVNERYSVQSNTEAAPVGKTEVIPSRLNSDSMPEVQAAKDALVTLNSALQMLLNQKH